MKNPFYKASVILSITYLVIVSIFLIIHGNWFSPDQFFAVALVVALILGRSREFVRDWMPFIALLLGYEYLRALIPKLEETAHIFPMIRFDQAIFGGIPSVQLQTALFTANNLKWYDYASVLVYISYFIVPMLVGFVFWITDKTHFRRYFFTLLLLHYAAFITFVAFPAMPPWMASQRGFIPPILDVSGTVSANFLHGVSLPTLYQFVGANLVAAVPSVHSAYPWLIFLFVVTKSRRWGMVFFLYMLAVWFAVVYLGEHYVFDVVAGWVYGTVAFLVVKYWHDRRHASNQEI